MNDFLKFIKINVFLKEKNPEKIAFCGALFFRTST